jgi:hypothetical protein
MAWMCRTPCRRIDILIMYGVTNKKLDLSSKPEFVCETPWIVEFLSGDDAMASSTYAFPSGRGTARVSSRPSGRSIWRRLLDAIVVARQHHAEREVRRYLEGTGGKFTDTVEREIEERLWPRSGDRIL